METKSKPLTREEVVCDACQGSGGQKLGLACKSCSGMGLGILYRDKFFYWGPKLGSAFINLSRFRNRIQRFLNLITFLIGLAGLTALGGWLWQAIGASYHFAILDFWRIRHWLLFVFWLSLIADMFIVYRLSEDESVKRKIIQFDYQAKRQKYENILPAKELKRIKFKNRVDVFSGFSSAALTTVEEAFLLADRLDHDRVEIVHLFFSALKDREVSAVFSRLNVNAVGLVEKIKHQLAALAKKKGSLALSNELKEVLIEAYLAAEDAAQQRVKPINFIVPAMAKDKLLAEILYDLEIDMDKMKNAIAWIRINERLLENYRLHRRLARFKPSSNMDRAYTAVATPTLNHFAYDLTLAAKWGKLDFCVAREKEIEEIFNAITSGRAGVVLAGEVGVGKRTVINGLAQLMVEENVPEILKDKRLLELDVSRLVSGAAASAAQERLLTIIDEAARAGNIIFYINNLENIVGITPGGEESLELSDVLASALERREIICLASVTGQNYRNYIEGRPLGDIMAKVEIKEAVGNQAIVIIESKIGYLEAVYKVYFTYEAIEQAVKLSGKYIHDKYLPSKAIDILESLAVKVARSGRENNLITRADVDEAISQSTGIPVTKVGAEEGRELLNLEEKIHQHMINQAEAVTMVAASLRRARAQLSEGKRPIANFLFLGPTGVGKTELAKTVTKVYFGSDKHMIRLDMSEYQAKDSVNKMIGGNTGAKGYLTEAVRLKPFALLLLDEFEKAHPDILNLFLQVMDDGRLTDGSGRTIDFTNCIIIATSNAAALFIREQIKAGVRIEKIQEALINDHLNQVMRPELINRFDGVIVFKPLGEREVIAIAKLMLNKTARTLEEKGIGLRLEEAGVIKLARLGYDPKFGARPLRRLLQDRVDNTIANKILAGELKRRDVVIINSDGEVSVEKGREL